MVRNGGRGPHQAKPTMGIAAFLRRLFRTGDRPQPGLYLYEVPFAEPISSASGDPEPSPNQAANLATASSPKTTPPRRRFHLRVHPDGSGLLFVDLADPVYLNPSATLLVWHALEGRSQAQALRQLCRWSASAAGRQLKQAAEAIFDWIARLKSGEYSCVWTALQSAGAFGTPTSGPEVSDSVMAFGTPSSCREGPEPAGAFGTPSSCQEEPGPVGASQQHVPKTIISSWADQRPIFSLPVQAPYKADVVLLYGCNNQCKHCYNSPERRHKPPMDLETWRRVVEKLVQLGVPHVILTGGEPTLCPDLPERILSARQRGLVVGLNTNGRRLADPAFTARLAEAGLDHVQITLASCRPEVHNALCQPGDVEQTTLANPFAETVQGIQNALTAGLHTLTNTTLTKINAPQAEELVDFLYRLGIRTFAMNGMIRSGRGKDFPDALCEDQLGPVLVRVRDRAKELGMRFLWYTPTCYCRFSPLELDLGARRCNAAQYSICIEPNGDVLPCQSYYQAVGNLVRDPWSAIWESPLFRRIRLRVQQPAESGLPEVCWECPDLPVCGGGCMLNLLENSQDGALVPLAATPGKNDTYRPSDPPS